MSRLTTLEDIQKARAALPDAIRRTPILPVARESGEIGAERLFVKAENLQVTGAYKPRAAFTVINGLSAAARSRGIVLTSSGNFAQGFAYAGRRTGVPVVVVMLDQASPFKVTATRDLGAEVVFCGSRVEDREPTVRRIAEERGMTAIDNWEERLIPAGHGSIGLEIVEDCPDVETILVPVSSGGLAAGVATAVKESLPHVKVIGVQPEKANAAYRSMAAGKPVAVDDWNSLADGLSAIRPGAWPFRHLQKYLDGIVLISEADMARAFVTLLFRAKVLAEPAGAVAAAALLADKVDTGRKTVALISGGNVTEAVIGKMRALIA